MSTQSERSSSSPEDTQWSTEEAPRSESLADWRCLRQWYLMSYGTWMYRVVFSSATLWQNGGSLDAVHASLGVCNKENAKKSQVVLHCASLWKSTSPSPPPNVFLRLSVRSWCESVLTAQMSRNGNIRHSPRKLSGDSQEEIIEWLFTAEGNLVAAPEFLLDSFELHCKQ